MSAAQVRAAAGAIEDQHPDAAVFEQLAPLGGRGRSGHHHHIAGGAAHHLRIERQAELRIHHDAQQRAAARQAGAVGQQAIVGQHGADAGENGVVIVAQFLHVGAGALAGDPAAIVVGRGDFAVQRDGGLERHQRPAGAHEVQERLIQLLGFGGEFGGHFHFDARLAQPAKSLARHQRVGVLDGRHHARHAGRNQGVGAGRRAALVGARLQVQVERGAARLLAGLRQRDHLGVLDAGVGVEAAAHHFAIAHQHGAHHGIRAGQRPALARQVERFAHVCGVHFSNSDSMNFSGSKGSRSSAFSPTPT